MPFPSGQAIRYEPSRCSGLPLLSLTVQIRLIDQKEKLMLMGEPYDCSPKDLKRYAHAQGAQDEKYEYWYLLIE